MKGFAARCVLLLLPMLTWVAGSAFAQTTWTGSVNTAWSNPGNWSAGVPDATDDVTIPDVASDPVIAGGTAALAKSVFIQTNALLTINTTGTLTINGSAAYTTPFTFNFTAGLNNLGTINNSGNITLGSVSSVGSHAIVNQGTFTNNAGGGISIDNTTDTGLFNAFGTFTNAAPITIGANTAIGLHGIWNDATFNNTTGGAIQIDRSSRRGLMNNADATKSISATFVNSATITIGASETVGKTGLENLATFTNNTGGHINIDHTSENGMYHASGTFTNAANITLGAVASVGTNGLVSWGTFNNNAGGHIAIDRATDFGLYIASGTFTNAANITIGAVVSGGKTGFENQATFNNIGGKIKIDNSTNIGFHHGAGTFTNEAAITIGAAGTVGTYGLSSQATFNNNTGGLIQIDRLTGSGLLNASGTFTNSSTITIGGVASAGETGLDNQGTFINTTCGKINIDRTSEVGLLISSGTFTNSSTIAIGAIAEVGLYGIRNARTFTNNTGGYIQLDRSTTTGLFNDYGSTFTNTADIIIGSVATVGLQGIWNTFFFNNNTGGHIRINRSSYIALFNVTGTFTNNADITIGAEASVGTYGLTNRQFFNNNASGSIHIDRSTDTGIYQLLGTFTNAGAITIGATETVGTHGIFNETSFSNNTGGTINIDRTTLAGLRNFNGTFTNQATMTIGALASVGTYGVYNQSAFANQATGQITINNAEAGMYLQGNTFANAGTVTIGALQNVTTLLTQQGAGKFSNNTGGTFKGTGTIAALSFTNAGGTLSPDYSPGKLTINESNDFSNSRMDIEVNGTATAGVNFDQIEIVGTATLGGSLTVSINYTPANGDEVTFLTTTSVTGTFSSVTGLPANWTVVYTATGVKLVYHSASPAPTLTAFNASSVSVCVGSPITFTATVGNVTGSYAFTLTNGGSGTLGTGSSASFSQPLTASGSGPQTFTLILTNGGQSTSATTTVTVNALPNATLTANLSGTLTCANPSLTLTAGNGLAYSFSGPGVVSQNTTSGTAVVNVAGLYSVTVTAGTGCIATANTTVSSNTVLVISTGSSLPQANVGVVVILTASGATSYQWTSPPTAQFTSAASSSALSASLTTAGVQTFTLVATAGICSQSAVVSVTALAGPDLTAIISLPDANFSIGDSKQLLMQVQEVNGSPTSTGNIVLTITVPTGYTISFTNSLTSIDVSGGEKNPVTVQNSKWHVSSQVAGQQLSLAINPGESVGANGSINVGFSISRTTANSGSSSNITVNVADDNSGSYDVNRLNNVYARIISGL